MQLSPLEDSQIKLFSLFQRVKKSDMKLNKSVNIINFLKYIFFIINFAHFGTPVLSLNTPLNLNEKFSFSWFCFIPLFKTCRFMVFKLHTDL